ncbi:uro-adherence factor A-like isoform X2 [Littorina saxatilis]|uniref:uro-adherence factor A-like isoform X2 n=1 Tax=Littorina saxatilis TaxID=31220 RepID=UPI0038B55215
MANRSIRLYVRTKRTYGPEYFQIPLWYIDVTDFAGCTVGKIKEACRSKKDSKPKVDDLFYQNQSLADDRSVAHYNLPDGAILETTSNPIMVAMIYTKMIEIERERDAHPDDIGVQRWTHKSHIKKQTLLSVLFNAKKLDDVQPPHFPTYDDFVIYLERLGRKGANVNPRYSGRDFVRWFAEYLELDTGQPDPVRSFQARHAARLGLTGPKGAGGEPAATGGDKKGKNPKGKGKQLVKRNPATAPARPRQPKQDRLCEDCEQNLAEIYCESCVGPGGSLGVLLCLECTHQVHRGALRGNHDCKDISEAPRAPRNPQGYCPHPYKAPFAIVLAMTRALSENRQQLSMDEEEIKQRAQPLTDTDLHDKQAGKIMGGFDCIENTLIPKNLIQKEASGRHTYALTQAGRELGQKLDIYDQALQRFLFDSRVPRLPARQNFSVGNQRLVLVVDEHERDLPRLHSLARTAGVKVIVRKLPVADYVWVLTPQSDPAGGVSYEGDHPEQEIMLPVLVERKSWNDLHDTMRFGRWDQQIRKMKACGLLLNFVLIEGCIDDLRQVTHDRKDKLQCDLERLSLEEGFHVGRTSCWSKSSAWLFWMTHLLASAYARGRFQGKTLLFSDLQSRVTRGLREMRAGRVVRPLHPPGPCHVWEADQLVTAIFRESLGEKKMEDTCRSVFQANEVRQLLVLRDMNAFNKNRHTLLYNCLRQASALEACTKDAVTALIEDQLMGNLKGLVHYDVFGFWQLSIQVNHQVYVMRSDTEEDTRKLTDHFSRGQQDGNTGGNNAAGGPTREHILGVPPANQQQNGAAASVTVQPTPSTSRAADEVGAGMGEEPSASLEEEADKTLEEDDFATDSQVEERMLQEALSLSLISSLETLDNDAGLSVSPASPATSIKPHQQQNELQSKSDTLHPTQSLHFTESSQSLDIIPPSISLVTSECFGSFPLSAPLSFAAGQTSKPETVCPDSDRVGTKTQNNNFLPASLNCELRHCRVGQNSRLGPPSDSVEWNPVCESTLACDDAASGVNTQDSLNDAGASYSPLGVSMDDAITIDSQGTDYEPDVDEVESRSAVHEDESLAKRLQEEENAKSCTLAESPTQEESLSILAPVQISQEPPETTCALGSVLSPRRKRRMKTAGERSSSVVPEKKSKSLVESDEELARRLQRELNGETEEGDGHFFLPPECPSGANSAAAYAPETVQIGESCSVKQLHKGPETEGINSESVQRIPNPEHCESLPVSSESVSALTPSTESDEALARRLAQEEKLKVTRKQTHSKELVSGSNKDESCGKNNVIDVNVSSFVDDDEALARRLQLEEELQNGNASTSGIQPASAEMAGALLEREQSPLSTSFGMDTFYIDEDERLARQLQEEEGLERKGAFSLTSTPVVPTKMSTSRLETQKVVGISAVEEDEQRARKLLLLEEGDTGAGISDHLQDDERLARMLQEQETKGSSADMKMDSSIDWINTENQGDVHKLFDGDSKLNVLSQLEEYRKSQEQKYASQNHITKKSPSFTRPSRKGFPASTSTPKRSTKNNPDGVTPGKQKHDTTFPKPGSPVGDAKTGFGRLGKAKHNTSLREDKAAARFSDIKGKTDGQASEKGAALQNFWNALTGDKAKSIKFGSMDTQKTSQQFGGVSGTGAASQFAAKRNIAATVTKSELNDSVDLTDGEDFPGGASFGQSSQGWKESSVLPPASKNKGDIGMNDSIDLTDDDVSFNASCYSKFSAALCDSVCKKDDSAFFSTLSGPKNGERNKEELDFKQENGATGAESSGDAVSTEVASNVRCGSCGQKGHNRRFEHCANYYSEKEMTRRQALEEAQRRRAEERARETEERQREEQRALQRLTTTRDGLQRNKEEMMQQIALATQQCATQFQTQLDDIDRLVKSKERKVKAYDARQGRK